MKIKSFTLTETIIVLIILGIIATILCASIAKMDIKIDSIKKAGANNLVQIDYATKQIFANYSTNNSMTKLTTTSGTKFSINDEDADQELINLYKNTLASARETNLDAGYLDSTLHNENNSTIGSGSGVKVSDFTQGIILKNETYFAIKLYDNCEESETYIYHPIYKDNRNETNSCGLIFYDVNREDKPNILGIDQYIVSIGKYGIK